MKEMATSNIDENPREAEKPVSPLVSSFADQWELADVILHKKERKRKRDLHPDIVWMLSSSHAFTPLLPTPKLHPLDRQNYQRWKVLYDSHKLFHPRRSRSRTIILQSLIHSLLASDYPMSQVELPLLEWLRQFCTVFFSGTTFLLDDLPIDLISARKVATRVHNQTQRRQLLVDDVMKYMKSHVSVRCYAIVGVTLVDLYPGPQWNFTLGQAYFSDGVAICSFGRHFNSEVSHSQSSPLHKQIGNLWVLLRVVTHEICHLFGLSHCYYFHCAMNESGNIDEAIGQPLFLCPVCLRKLHKVLKFDVQQRYSLLKSECCKLLDKLKYICQKIDVSHEDVYILPISSLQSAIDWLEQCLKSFV